MFKSELLILIFLLVILAILHFNTTNIELFTSKKIKITKEFNKNLITNNLQRIIYTIDEYKILDKEVKKLQDHINIKTTNKLERMTIRQDKNKIKTDLEIEKNTISLKQSDYKSLLNNTKTSIISLKNNIGNLNNTITKQKEQRTNIEREKQKIKNVSPNDIRFKYLLVLENPTEIENNIISKLLKLDDKYKSLDTTGLTLERNQKQKEITDLSIKIEELNLNITQNNMRLTEIKLELSIIINELRNLNKEISKLEKEIEELEIQKEQKIIERTNKFNNLNEQLVSYELEELIEDLEKLKETQEYYKEMLEEFKKKHKIEFGELKVNENDYRKYHLIDNNLKDDDKQKRMYYKLTTTELNSKLNELCDINDSAKYCKTKDYNKVCKLDAYNNEITDTYNTNIFYNDQCMKTVSFINKLPYT
tara:strand:- start:1014 stop:2276 length:1263 start_codon:yes stop_codon:yes gene_type:complete